LKKLIFALLTLLPLLSAIPASAGDLNGDNANDYIEHANDLGYSVSLQVLPTGICGETDPNTKDIYIDPQQGCKYVETLAHEVGHALNTSSTFTTSDKNKFIWAMYGNQRPSQECVYLGDNATPAKYENSFCELWASSAAASLGQPVNRSAPGRHNITQNMIRQVSKEFMINIEPTYSCRIERHYRIWLGRAPDQGGYAYWMDRVWRYNLNLDWLAGYFERSGEYRNNSIYRMTNRQFANHLIVQTARRAPYSTAELNFWHGYVNQHGRVHAAKAALTSGVCANNPSSVLVGL